MSESFQTVLWSFGFWSLALGISIGDHQGRNGAYFKRLNCKSQRDQIVRFIAIWGTFERPNHSNFSRICEGCKSLIFRVKIVMPIFGQLFL